MVRRGLARSRAEATDLVAQGRVRVAGRIAEKPATALAPDDPIVLAQPAAGPLGPRYVSRGGPKLVGALNAASNNLTAADTNEEGANLLALQTRQSLSSTALTIASQSGMTPRMSARGISSATSRPP